MAVVAATGLVAGTPAHAVVGGTPGNVGYFAQVLVYNNQGYGVCGGTAIGGDWILTAAHCLTDIPNRTITNAYFCGHSGCGYYQAVDVVIHPLWDGDHTHGHDLALLRMGAGALQGAPTIPKVGSPWDPGAYAAGTRAQIMGYGATHAGGPVSDTLLVADTVLVSDDSMDSEFNPWLVDDNWVEPLMIGAGSSPTTVCRGDSGGPLVVHPNGGVAVQVGVASFMYTSTLDSGCDSPAGFAELSGPQLAWLATQVPSITSGWGICTASDGYAGTPLVHYSTTGYADDQRDGPYWWQISCQIPGGVSVPNVLGLPQATAQNVITSLGLAVGTVSSHNDCASTGDVETQNPGAGAVVRPGTAVNLTVSACTTNGGGGGGRPPK